MLLWVCITLMGSALASWASASLLPLSMAALLVSAYSIALLYDLRSYYCGEAVGGALTSVGKCLVDERRAWKFRLDSATWEVQARLASHAPLAAETLKSISASGEADSEVPQFFKEVLGALSGRFRHETAALLLVEGASVQIYSLQGLGRRLQTQLIKMAQHEPPPERQPMLYDCAENRSQLYDFSLFGVRQSITAKFMLHDCTGYGVLWLGYGSSRPPVSIELVLIEETVRRLEAEFDSYRVLHQLSHKVKEVESREQEKNQFLAHVSHDIRSPLNNVKAILAALDEERLTSDARELLQVALRNCDSAHELVQDILDFTRHKAGKLSARPELLDINEIAGLVLEELRFAARSKGIELALDEAPQAFVIADRIQTKRVLANVVGNAIKYTEYGSVRVQVVRRASNWCVVEVHDTGRGLSADQLSRLFTPFTRFHSTVSEGIGLGLALSKILVELNGGTINALSERDRGTVFSIGFPAAEALPSSEPLPQAKKYRLREMAVLVVDDDVQYVQSLARVLRAEGAIVTEAYTVHDALSVLNYEKFHLLVSDDNMPQGGAFRILQQLQELQISIPTLVLSGDDSRRSVLLGHGAQAVLLKDGNVPALLQEMENLIAAPVRRLKTA